MKSRMVRGHGPAMPPPWRTSLCLLLVFFVQGDCRQDLSTAVGWRWELMPRDLLPSLWATHMVMYTWVRRSLSPPTCPSRWAVLVLCHLFFLKCSWRLGEDGLSLRSCTVFLFVFVLFCFLQTWQLSRVIWEEGNSVKKMRPSESQWSIFLNNDWCG